MKTAGVAVIGMGWMGAVHARAFIAAARMPDVPLKPRLMLCAEENEERLRWALDTFGFAAGTGDWRQAVCAPEVDIVSVAVPTHLHAEVVAAAAQNGKHVYCEKPAGRNLDETERAARAVRDAGVLSAVGYNYRHFPMVQYFKQLLEAGKLGATEQFNARFLSMYGSNPLSRLSWRFQNRFSGSGAVVDILTHAIDMAHYLVGPVRRVSANRHTFIKERPLPAPGGTHFSLGAPDDPRGAVENDDYVAALVEFECGARGTLEASRVARGPKCELGFEWYGERGSARWDFERMNELELYQPHGHDDNDHAHEGFTRLLAGEAHPDHARFNPGDGIGIGYEDSKVLEAVYLLRDVAAGRQRQDGLAQALAVARVTDAILRSCENGRWEEAGA